MWWNHHILLLSPVLSHWVTPDLTQDYWFCSPRRAESNRVFRPHDRPCHETVFDTESDGTVPPGTSGTCRSLHRATSQANTMFNGVRRWICSWGIQWAYFQHSLMMPCRDVDVSVFGNHSQSFWKLVSLVRTFFSIIRKEGDSPLLGFVSSFEPSPIE